MGKQYSHEYREQILSLNRAGRSAAELAREFKPCYDTIRNWIDQDKIDRGERDGVTTEEKEEIRQLRDENRRLRQEREILKKAMVWCAQEMDPTRLKGPSNS